MKSVLSSARILTMQKFIEADYYELDWYYEECSDGNYGSLQKRAGMWRDIVSLRGGVVVLKPFVGTRAGGGGTGTHTAAGMHGSDRFEGTVEEMAGGQGHGYSSAVSRSLLRRADGIGMQGL